MATVVLHITENGFDLLATPDVERVVWVDENIPNDRTFETARRYTLAEIEALIGNGAVGHAGDGRVSENMRQAILAKLEPTLRLVPTEEPAP